MFQYRKYYGRFFQKVDIHISKAKISFACRLKFVHKWKKLFVVIRNIVARWRVVGGRWGDRLVFVLIADVCVTTPLSAAAFLLRRFP